MRVLPYGDRAVLVEVDELTEVLDVASRLRADPVPFTVDLVPAARTVLIRATAAITPDGVRAHLAGLPTSSAPGPARPAPPTVEIDVRYDGVDLDEVGGLTGLSPTEVVAAHTGTHWTAAFCGFSPGFAYLFGGDPRLRVPRRRTPRTRVPAGSVALADGYSAVYPTASPGGWRLIGRTEGRLWDVDRDPPALLLPGTTVRFRAVTR